MEIKNEGVCRFCLQSFSGAGIGRHLLSCKKKNQKDSEEAKYTKNPYDIYHIHIQGYKPYWLHIEMKANAKLDLLDSFLRDIWLECCGHLSAFTIDNMQYESYPSKDPFWGTPSKSMDVLLKKILSVHDIFDYEYDFGTTTFLSGKILSMRKGYLHDDVRILARNNPPKFDCSICDGEATDYCIECDYFYCEACLNDHECGWDMSLPVVNSPRMGECGYAGEGDFDTFKIPE